MSWAFWLEGVCIPIISTFGLLGKSSCNFSFSSSCLSTCRQLLGNSPFSSSCFATSRQHLLHLGSQQQESPPGPQPNVHLPSYLSGEPSCLFACLSHPVACLVICPFYWWSILIKICLVHCFIYYSWIVCQWMLSSEVILSCIFLKIVCVDAFITVSCYLSYYLPGDQFFN